MNDAVTVGRFATAGGDESAHSLPATGNAAETRDWPRPGDDDHASAFEGTLADGLDDEPAAFRCVPDESGGLADTPWVYCAGCARTIAAVERAGAWWCAGCGDRLAFRPVLDRDPGDEQPEAA